MPASSSAKRRRGLVLVAALAAAVGVSGLALASGTAGRTRAAWRPPAEADALTRAKCAWADRDLLQAERLLRTWLDGRPDDAAAASLLGRVLLDLGRLDAAQALFAARVQAHPEDVEALRGLAAVSQAQGRADLALVYLHRAADLRKDDALLWKELATAQRSTGDGLGALASAQQAMAADPQRQDLRDLVADLAQSDVRPPVPGSPAAASRLPGHGVRPDPLRRFGASVPPDPRPGSLVPVAAPSPSGRQP
jgi:tetratricopeptide (TPR) repeat protein